MHLEKAGQNARREISRKRRIWEAFLIAAFANALVYWLLYDLGLRDLLIGEDGRNVLVKLQVGSAALFVELLTYPLLVLCFAAYWVLLGLGRSKIEQVCFGLFAGLVSGLGAMVLSVAISSGLREVWVNLESAALDWLLLLVFVSVFPFGVGLSGILVMLVGLALFNGVDLIRTGRHS